MITEAGSNTPNAVGLVYIAAFGLDEGEAFSEVYGKYGETPILNAAKPSNYPLPNGESGVELTIDPELYKEAFGADLSDEEIRVLAVRQWPFSAIFEDKPTTAAWKSLPSWYLVASEDNAIPPQGQREMAKRMGAQTVEVDASHSVALSQPAPVAEIIRSAVEVTSAG